MCIIHVFDVCVWCVHAYMCEYGHCVCQDMHVEVRGQFWDSFPSLEGFGARSQIIGLKHCVFLLAEPN